MNVREGTRRLGVLLGVLGGVIGAFAEYPNGLALWNARQTHKRFESLMASPAMQAVAKAAKNGRAARGAPEPGAAWCLALLEQVYGSNNIVEPATVEDLGKLIRAKHPAYASIPDAELGSLGTFAKEKCSQYPRFAQFADIVNVAGIGEATVDQAGTVTSIRLATAESVRRIDPPPLTAWLSLLIYPLVGFLVPWVAVPAVAWVVVGFLGTRPSTPR